MGTSSRRDAGLPIVPRGPPNSSHDRKRGSAGWTRRRAAVFVFEGCDVRGGFRDLALAEDPDAVLLEEARRHSRPAFLPAAEGPVVDGPAPARRASDRKSTR